MNLNTVRLLKTFQIFLFIAILIGLNQKLVAFSVIAPEGIELESYKTLIEQAVLLLPAQFKSELPSDIQFELKEIKETAHASMDHKIRLSKQLFKMYIQNPNQEHFVKFTRHPSFKTYLTATIIHELSHIYDSTGRRYSEIMNGRFYEKQCQNSPFITLQQEDALTYCTILKNGNGRISSDPQFANLIFSYFYNSTDSLPKRGNFNENRTVDPYEYMNPQEAFAVNMEHFLLDPQFKCRRPSYYQYLSAKFSFAPFAEETCAEYSKIFYLSPTIDGLSALEPTFIRPRGKLYQVHYFIAGAGTGIMSRFGHSMLRLVYCDPKRETASSDCLYDFEYHIVVGPGAGVLGLDFSSLDGLSGNYKTNFGSYSLSSVILQYNHIEERELFSIPLDLSLDEIQKVELNLLEAHWTYQNKYYFLSNNCATEILNILKRSLPEKADLQSAVTNSPFNLLEKLYSSRLVSESNLDLIRIDKSKRWYFPSQKANNDKTEAMLFSELNMHPQKSYRVMSFEERLRIANVVINGSERSKKMVIYLEKQIQLRLINEISSNFFKNVHERNVKTLDLITNEDLIAAKSTWLVTTSILSSEHYGLPSDKELDDILKNRMSETIKYNQSRLEKSKLIYDYLTNTTQMQEINKSKGIIKSMATPLKD